MFHLIKILNGRAGVPEPERVSLTAPVTVEYGTPVVIKGGTLVKADASLAALPTHLVLCDAKNASEVLVSPISPEMVFEVPAAAIPTAMTVGSEYLLSSDGKLVTATAVTSGKRGATLVSKAGAQIAGDNLLVAFRN